ncbi:MAG: hypothetical protein F2563_04110 [Actinobacteria bacterium]|uniref:Unannotated protein n=1 Tax=freshwater metagenome TaxID=449393 RepID=A0A6J6EX62_9ZZZZ|nr:hypothetical protein [Actinomycetota bacterium]
MAQELENAARLAAVAAGMGAIARVALALHGGVRRAGLLVIECVVGASLGVMAAGAIAYWEPEVLSADRAFLVMAGAAGVAGAIGTRLLDLLTAWMQRRAGV